VRVRTQTGFVVAVKGHDHVAVKIFVTGLGVCQA
jgi:hypothetical protein